jgi:hypothetical protein
MLALFANFEANYERNRKKKKKKSQDLASETRLREV